MATSSPGTVVVPFIPAHHAHLIPYLAALHASCITHDHAIATFIPPLSHEKLLSWWKDRIAEVSAGTRLICLLVKESAASVTLPGAGSAQNAPIKGTDVLGVVMLHMPHTETDALRASVETLLIHTTHRRRGGATSLLQTLESEAALRGKTLLVGSLTIHPGTSCKDRAYTSHSLSNIVEIKDFECRSGDLCRILV